MRRLPTILLALLLIVMALGAATFWYLSRDVIFEVPDLEAMRRVDGATLPEVAPPHRAASAAGRRNVLMSGRWFKDADGRVMLLRGVNLGGSTKVPYSPGLATHVREGFFDAGPISFVGRPFPLEKADEHFARLRAWGFRFLRLLVTWEAIEHDGPGVYDKAYLTYVRAVVEKASQHGIDVFIDPHQDVWSRFSGGDGAPRWTFEKVGLDVTTFKDTGAAIVHNTHGDPYPRMIWPTNAAKYASATMFTLFFGGNAFAPRTLVNGTPVQEYLQSHYIEAIRQVALRLRDLPNVIGFDTLNEPSAGYIGEADLGSRGLPMLGASPSLFEGMALASGFAREVPEMALGYTGFKEVGRVVLNQGRATAWLPPRTTCVWREHGLWDVDANGEPVIRRTDYFVSVGGRRVDFVQDHLKPFVDRFARMLREVDPTYAVFVESPPMLSLPSWAPGEARGFVNAGHWYDFITLVTKRSTPWFTVDVTTTRTVFGRGNVQRLFTSQLAAIARESEEKLHGAPTLVGELGIPFDMHDGEAFRTGDFAAQEGAMERSLAAAERNLLSYTLWNYTADNTNDRGDQWNGEDLSVFSRDQQRDRRDVNSGGRALRAVLRAHPLRIAGVPVRSAFDGPASTFVLDFIEHPEAMGPTEIFLPRWHYGRGFEVFLSDGRIEKVRGDDVLVYRHEAGRGRHEVVIRPRQ